MINGLNVLPSSDKHHINANKYDCYFNTNEQRIYVHDGIKWVCLSVADPSLNNNYFNFFLNILYPIIIKCYRLFISFY